MCTNKLQIFSGTWMSHPSSIFFPSTLYILPNNYVSAQNINPLCRIHRSPYSITGIVFNVAQFIIKIYDIFFFKSIMDNSSKSLRYMKGTMFPLHEIINTYNLWYIFV